MDDDGRRTLTVNPEACVHDEPTRRYNKRKTTSIVHEFQ